MEYLVTKKEIAEGKELIKMLENLSIEEKKQVLIYASALSDRNLIKESVAKKES